MDQSLLIRYLDVPCDLIMCDEVDSTNDALKRIARSQHIPQDVVSYSVHHDKRKEGQEAPLIAIAQRQTAGRGRFGREWVSPPGSIYCSMMYTLHVDGSCLAALPLVVGCALHEALSMTVAETNTSKSKAAAPLYIKWPNDIVACRHGSKDKLAGILVEVLPGPDPQANSSHVIIGMGVNVFRPFQNEYTAKQACYVNDLWNEESLVDQSAQSRAQKPISSLSLEMVAASVINAVFAHVNTWMKSSFMFAPFKDHYEQNMALRGDEVVARRLDGSMFAQGTVLGVNEHGQLLIQEPKSTDLQEKVITITVGDITLRNAEEIRL